MTPQQPGPAPEKALTCDVEECHRCNGSGEIGVDICGRFECAGPIRDDAKNVHITTCPDCLGCGYLEVCEE